MISKIADKEFSKKIQLFIDRFVEKNPDLPTERTLIISEKELLGFKTDDIRLILAQIKIPNTIGFLVNNVRLENLFPDKMVHLVILNKERIDKLDLDENELHALILHELGHIYNNPLEINQSDDVLAPKITGELYADSFVKQQGFAKELIEVHEKYVKMPVSENKEEILERIIYLKNGSIYSGGYRKLRDE